MLFYAYASFVPFANTLASYGIGSDPVGLRSMPSFTEANLSLALDQGKHRVYSLYMFSLYNAYHYVLACALKYRSLMKP
jgi:hypothetical protein